MIGELTILFSVLAFITNSVIVGSLLRNYDALTPMLMSIANLLLLDGIFAFIGATFRGPGIIRPDFYEMNVVTKTLCPFMPFFITWIPPLCSIAILIITMDRYVAIKYPLSYSTIVTPNRVLGLITTTWLFQLVKCLVEVVLDNFTVVLSVDFDGTLKRCEFNSTLYVYLVQVCYYFVPFLLMCGLYVGIFKEVWTTIIRDRRMGIERRREGSPLRKKLKIVITLSLITVGFFIAWFPYFYSLTEHVLFGIYRPGFKWTIVMFYFNLLWDSLVYAIRIPSIYAMILRSFVFRWCYNRVIRARLYIGK